MKTGLKKWALTSQTTPHLMTLFLFHPLFACFRLLPVCLHTKHKQKHGNKAKKDEERVFTRNLPFKSRCITINIVLEEELEIKSKYCKGQES